MKKNKFLTILAVFCLWSGMLFAAPEVNYQDFELDSLLHNIDQPGEPLLTDDYIIFTADVNHRFVGIAFDYENYQVIHPFQLLTNTDENGKVTKKHMFYCYKRQHKFNTLRYRLIIDGLWTIDPLNSNKYYDESVNLYFSVVEAPGSVEFFTQKAEDDSVHFIYKGKEGLNLRLAGTFTNWDPWIYELVETSPGLYELDLPLTSGTYYYSYYVGLTPILDNTNPNKAYSVDGRSVNYIVVD